MKRTEIHECLTFNLYEIQTWNVYEEATDSWALFYFKYFNHEIIVYLENINKDS